MFLSLSPRRFGRSTRNGNILLLASAAFAVGLTSGALLAPALSRGAASSQPMSRSPVAANVIANTGYPVEVLRVFDGDTFEARVRIWPGTDVTTRVRLRGIDAPEMRGRCDDERDKAIAARDALTRILAEGGIGISHVGQDKYGGRVDADASTAQTPDVAGALLAAGHARAYGGGRREGWCVAAR
jgi:endonuclease YncB( thermonuclease family)